MALISGSVLFVFRLPDISRTFLVALFPAQWAVTLVSRVLLRLTFERLRARGYNQRFVLVVGTGQEALAFARKVEDHRELGLEIRGFLDDERGELPKRWTYLGRLDRIEEVLHTLVVDEVAVCLPIDRWEHLTAIIRLCEEEGKIVRVPMGALDAAFSKARVEDLDGTPVYSFVNGPDRAVGLLVKRALDVAAVALGLLVLSPVLAAIAVTAIVLAFFAVDTLRNAPETFTAIVGIALLSVLLDFVWKRARDRGGVDGAAAATTD
jgi:hypothetical protein